MPKPLAFIVPLPPIEASLNFKPASRGGRMAQNAAIQQYKEHCARIIKRHLKGVEPAEGMVEISYSWFLGRREVVTEGGERRTLRDALCRPKDRDNAIGAAKPIQDALQLAGYLPKGDAAKRVKLGDVELYGKGTDHQGHMGVFVLILPVEAEVGA